MSKAFTKESDDAPDADALPRAPTLPAGAKNYTTRAGASRLRAELDRLQAHARPAAARAVAAAEGPAALAEARRRLREIEQRVAFLAGHLDTAEVVDPVPADPSRVRFGAAVTVRDGEDRAATWRIVGVAEADAREGRVSWLSPVAQALLGAAVGDVVVLRSPRGEEELEVEAIAYDEGRPLTSR